MSTTPQRVFWSGVRGQAHVLYGSSWLQRLLATTEGPVTLVTMGVSGFRGRQTVSLADVERLLPHDERLTVVDAASEGLSGRPGEHLTYLATGAPGIKPWLRLVAANRGRRFDVVVTDEGISSYGTWSSRRDAWRREGHREPWPTVRALAVAGARQVLTTRRWALYEPSGGGIWSVNPVIAAEFARHATGVPDPAPRAVFLAQPWVELGVIDEPAYVAHVAEGAQQCERAGLGFVVRPHPIEDAARYDRWQVLAGPEPAELDRRVTSATAVVGATSTALLNLAALFKVPAARVQAEALAFLEDGLAAGQRSLLDAFVAGPLTPMSTLGDWLAPLTQAAPEGPTL